ncbi:MAG TPA: hypothetical protein VFU13_11755 [Steroidobacteraceae bacterium]|nr:hypothetical protein [Steroidobacteraceae bacterium]
MRVLLVPFHPTNLLMVGVFAVLVTFFLGVGFYGWFFVAFLQVWVFKYCYALIQHLADGASEPPVMDTDILSPMEVRPWIQGALVFAGVVLCQAIGGKAGLALGIVLLALFPATVAILGFGEQPWQAVNPVTWFRVIRGLGPYYVGLLLALAVCAGVGVLLYRVDLWRIVATSIALWCEVAFFSLVGAALFLRRRQLGFEPSRSPERAAARAEAERLKERARMVDDVFQLVRIGKHVDATAPLARWLNDTEPEHLSKDAYHVAEQALKWEMPAAVNTLGSTLIRHLMRYGRPDAALAVFEILRTHTPTFTMDSVADLRTLAEFAESIGRETLAQTMRLETPVFHPQK